jgi:ribosomal-protein-alanine N-acetyltransferase
MILATSRLKLRHLTLTDAAFVLELVNTSGFLNNIGDKGVRDLFQAEAYLSGNLISSYQKYGYGLYLVELTETGEVVGLCGLVKRDTLPLPDVGYAFLPEFWGKGYALESAKGVVEHARGLKLRNLMGIVSPGNDASIKVLEKLGMQFDGRQKWDDSTDIVLYKLMMD